MSTIAFDTETELIAPGVLIPRLVCLSYSDGTTTDLIGQSDAADFFRAFPPAYDLLVGHNVAYDLAVLCRQDPKLVPGIFDLYEQDRIRDTMIREQLARIRDGSFQVRRQKKKYSLAALAGEYLGRSLDKSADTWRLRYGELINTPIAKWPEDARRYACEDARATYDVFVAQPTSPDEGLQCRAAFALHLMSAWGVRTDAQAIAELEIALLEKSLSLRDSLVDFGLIRRVVKTQKQYDGHLKRATQLASELPEHPSEKQTKALEAARERCEALPGSVEHIKVTSKLKRLVQEALGEAAPRTAPTARHPNGQVKTDEDTLSMVADQPELQRYAKYVGAEKLLTTYVAKLWDGTARPINSRFHALVESGRTSSSGPNLQNPPRAGGVRECYVPRPGRMFATADYDTFELRGLAQVTYSLFGESEMRAALIAGKDLHLDLAAQLRGISYERAASLLAAGDVPTRDARQFAKIGNFGFPAGLGAETFVVYARGYGYETTLEDAEALRDTWFSRWPEMRTYFARVAEQADELGPGRVTQLRSGRVRGGVTFCSAANTMFQGLCADAAKAALWQVSLRCYTKPSSALFGSRPWCLMHDEILIEAPEDRAAEAGDELADVMCSAAAEWLPDVPVTASPALMRRWEKGVETKRDENGRLTC